MFKQKTTEQIKAATRKTYSGSHAFYNNPKYRAWIYQILLVLGLAYFFFTIISNTLGNLESAGIKSGFGFLDNAAGYDVLMSLIPFESTDTYFKVFVVGLLNTILVSILGIFFATVLGFIFGVMYFSKNFLIQRASVIYVEIFRNIPLLLQVFFWYFAVLATLPGVRDSLSLGEAVFLNVRGLFFPKLIGGDGSIFVYAAIVIAVVVAVVIKIWAKKRQNDTGQQFPVLYAVLGVIFAIPIAVGLIVKLFFGSEFKIYFQIGDFFKYIANFFQHFEEIFTNIAHCVKLNSFGFIQPYKVDNSCNILKLAFADYFFILIFKLLILIVLFLIAKKAYGIIKQFGVNVNFRIAIPILIVLIVICITIFIWLLSNLLANMPFTLQFPELKGFGFRGGVSIIPELMALVTALSVYTGAFIAEAVRAGIQSVPKGQTEAARSVGLKESKIMSLIIVPQAMRVIVPLLNSEYQSLVKNSTLAAAIAYPDLFNVFIGTALNQTGQAIETIFMAIIVYFSVNMLISFIMNRFNSNVELVGR